jgi:predicted MFS family arabinose efflux permease
VSPRLATALVFFVNGAGVGTLLPQVPYLRDELDISKGVIGLCLLAMTAGALIAMPIAGQLLDRHPSRTIVRWAIAVYPLALAFPLLANTPVALAALLFVFGAANGFVDISMNAHGAAIERDEGRPIMSSLHGGWSVGGVAGATAVGLSAGAGLDPRAHMVVTAVILCVIGVAAARFIGDADVVAEEQSAGFRLPPRDVILLGALCILVMVTEGAMNDWSPLYLREDLGTSAAVAASGFAAFSAGMAAGRFAGDAIVARLGAERVLRGGAAIAAVVLGTFLAIGSPVAALPGLALVGLGVANGVPLLFSAAGRTATPGPAIAAVGTMGYVAFLGGPPFLGFLADGIGLPKALSTICIAALIVVLLGGRPYREERATRAARREARLGEVA